MTDHHNNPFDTLAEQRAGRTIPLDQVRREMEAEESEPTTATISALASVHAERLRQQEKWGTQRHSWPEWMSILTEEVGEASTLANWLHWSRDINDPLADWVAQLRTELVQVAAVAVQIIDHLDEIARHTADAETNGGE